MRTFRKINTDNLELDQVQTNTEQVLQPLAEIPHNDGAKITVKLAIGSNRISQPLTRKPLGWYVTDKNAVADIYRTDWDTRTISLTSTAVVTVDLWIF